MGQGRTDYFARQQWNFQCDQCGQTFKSGKAKHEWDGLIVCPSCLDPRHPQELVRPVTDPKPIPWARPFADVYVNPNPDAVSRIIDGAAIDSSSMG
jgi:hypothetical protein